MKQRHKVLNFFYYTLPEFNQDRLFPGMVVFGIVTIVGLFIVPPIAIIWYIISEVLSKICYNILLAEMALQYTSLDSPLYTSQAVDHLSAEYIRKFPYVNPKAISNILESKDFKELIHEYNSKPITYITTAIESPTLNSEDDLNDEQEYDVRSDQMKGLHNFSQSIYPVHDKFLCTESWEVLDSIYEISTQILELVEQYPKLSCFSSGVSHAQLKYTIEMLNTMEDLYKNHYTSTRETRGKIIHYLKDFEQKLAEVYKNMLDMLDLDVKSTIDAVNVLFSQGV